MPVRSTVVSESHGIDGLLEEFTFMENGKKYRVVPKPGTGNKIEPFYKFVKFVCPKQGISAFSYRGWDNYLDIARVGAGAVKPEQPKPAESKQPEPKPAQKKPDEKPRPEAVQLSLFDDKQASLGVALRMECLASELREKGLPRVAEMLKPLALRFRKAWMGPKSIGFFDDLGNANIEPEKAIAVLDALEGGAYGPGVSKATGLEEALCGKVLELAKKHLLSEDSAPANP